MEVRTLPELGPLYSPRNGAGVEADIHRLFVAPEHTLGPEDTEEIIEYSYQLLEGETDHAKCEAGQDFETLQKTPATSAEQAFYLGYFLTPQGRADLKSLGIDDMPTFKGGRELLNDTEKVVASAPAKFRKEVAARSLKWYKAGLAERLAQDHHADRYYTPEEQVTVHYEPEKLLAKLESLQAYRRFYAQQAREVQAEESSALNAAKLVLLTLYRGRANNTMANMYPHAFNVAQQLYGYGGSQKLKERLKKAVPVVAHLFEHEPRSEREALVREFARRLDHVRNGADWQEGPDGSLHISPISRELRGLVTQLNEKAPLSSEPLLPPEVIEEIKHTQWDAQQLKSFNEAVLQKWGMLSEYTVSWDEAKARTGPAPDGLFQVVIRPEKDSFAVDSARRLLLVPESFDRGLIDESPAGALPLSAHELEHCVQALFDDEMGKQVALARIKGRRHTTMREAGGVYNEAKLLKNYFGIHRKTNTHYLHALDAKLGGANLMQTIRAFYNSLRRSASEPWTDTQEAAMRKLAVDRTLRLYRNGGYNSQPLDYIEQVLIVDALQNLPEEQVNAFLTAAGSFNPSDTLRLHNLGLATIPKQVEINVVDDVMQVFLEQFWQK